MNMTRRIWIQIIIFTVVSLLALTIMALGYVKLPTLLFGVGRYTVTVELPEAGGLYARSNVSYRGTEVGQVKSVRLTDAGVEAEMELDSGIDIPSDLKSRCTAQALSASSSSPSCHATPRHGHSRTAT